MSGTVIVVGSVNVDLVVLAPRLPAPGETVVGGTFSQAHGGKGANQAAAAAALGASTRIVGMVGDDQLGREARADLRERSVDVSELGTGSAHTGVALIVVDERGENLIAVASGANAELTGEWVTSAFSAIDTSLGRTTPVVLTNLEIPDEAIGATARAAYDRGWPFVLNPAPARPLDRRVIGLCDVLVPNEHEVGALGWASAEALVDAGAGAVVVTLGSAGATLHRPGAEPVHRDAIPVDVVDTTGAGDAFCGALATWLAEEAPLEDALDAAVIAGGLATRAVGARESLPARPELERELELDARSREHQS